MEHLPTIYAAAVLLPLASFFAILLFARQLGRFAGWVATSAILGAGALSFLAFGLWVSHHFPEPVHHGGHSAVHEEGGENSHGGKKKSEVRNQKPEGSLPVSMVSLVQEPSAAREAPHAADEAPDTEHHGDSHPVYSGEYY